MKVISRGLSHSLHMFEWILNSSQELKARGKINEEFNNGFLLNYFQFNKNASLGRGDETKSFGKWLLEKSTFELLWLILMCFPNWVIHFKIPSSEKSSRFSPRIKQSNDCHATLFSCPFYNTLIYLLSVFARGNCCRIQ